MNDNIFIVQGKIEDTRCRKSTKDRQHNWPKEKGQTMILRKQPTAVA